MKVHLSARFHCVAMGAVLLSAACAHTPQREAETPRAADFWPLAVGNSWTYRVTLSGASQENTVSIVSQDAEGFFLDSQGSRMQVHAAGLFDGERFLLRDPIELGSKWMAVPSANSLERFEIIAVGFTATVPAGVYDNCVRVQAVNRVNADEAMIAEWTYAPQVGLIQFNSRFQAKGKELPQTEMVLLRYEASGGA